MDAWIVDLDGTLYYQRPVRLAMGLWMGGYYLTRIWRIKELFAVMAYRKSRETQADYDVKRQYAGIAEKFHMKEEQVERFISEWMIRRPMRILKKYADGELIGLLRQFQTRGGTVIVYSDYPTVEKLSALQLDCRSYCAADEGIECLKPSNRGLEFILQREQLDRRKVLFIGDRDSKDGECARRSQVDYLILSRSRRGRREQLKKLGEKIK